MINKNLMLVAMLSMGTALTTLGKLKPALASLTPPATYAYSYTWNAAASEQYFNANGVNSIPLYTRIVDGIYFNYLNTLNIIDGFVVTQRFNRSNTTWESSGMFYKPDENRIGSNSSVGSISQKFDFTFDNQTNRDFILFFDTSSTSGEFNVDQRIDTAPFGFYYGQHARIGPTSLSKVLIPSFTNLKFWTMQDSGARYFDAWYLQDLGISDAYQAGYDANRGGILTDYLGTDAQQIGWVLLGIAAILFVFKGGK
jgi:hypothetical protein